MKERVFTDKKLSRESIDELLRIIDCDTGYRLVSTSEKGDVYAPVFGVSLRMNSFVPEVTVAVSDSGTSLSLRLAKRVRITVCVIHCVIAAFAAISLVQRVMTAFLLSLCMLALSLAFLKLGCVFYKRKIQRNLRDLPVDIPVNL